MGSFLSLLAGKLMAASEEPKEIQEHTEVDHNACICCGTLNIHEDRDDTEEKTPHR